MAHHEGYASHPLGKTGLNTLTALFFGLVAVLYLFGHNLYGLFDVDEAIFTQASVEMLENSQYIAPTYNGEPRYHKPPLIYWIQSASLNIFGTDSVFGARLPSAVFGLGTIMFFFLFLKTHTSSVRFSLTASAILGLNLSWLIVVRSATADAALNFFIVASTCTLLSCLYGEKRIWKQTLAGLLLAGAMLSKGPVALLVPGIVVLTVWIMKPNKKASILATNPLIITSALVAGILPWLVLMVHTSGWDFFKEFWLVHNWGRFTHDMGNSQSSSAMYYVWVLLIGFFPWILYMPRFLVALHPLKIMQNLRDNTPLTVWPALGLIWGVGVVLFFSFSGTKLAHYIVPALPGFALFLAGGMESLSLRRQKPLYTYIMLPFVVVLAFLLLSFNSLLTMLRAPKESALFDWLQNLFNFSWPPKDGLTLDILTQNIPLNWAPYGMGFILIFGVLQGIKLTSMGFRQGVALQAATLWLVLMLLVTGLVPTVDKYLQAPLRAVAQEIKQTHTPTTKLIYVGLHKPSVRLISGLPFIGIARPSILENIFQRKGDYTLLYEKHTFEDIKKTFPAKSIWQKPFCRGGYCVISIEVNK